MLFRGLFVVQLQKGYNYMALTNDDLKMFGQLLDDKLEEKLNPVTERLDAMDIRLDRMDERLDKMDTRLDGIDERLDKVDTRLDGIDGRLDKVDCRLNILEFRQNHFSKKLEDLQLDMKIFERNVNRSLHRLTDEMETVIVILKQSGMVTA